MKLEVVKLAKKLSADAIAKGMKIPSLVRRNDEIRATQIAMYLVNVIAEISVMEAASLFGRSHSTITQNVETVEDWRDCPEFDKKLEAIEEQFAREIPSREDDPLKGVFKVISKYNKAYYYAWRGGPRIKGEPGTSEFLENLKLARQ